MVANMKREVLIHEIAQTICAYTGPLDTSQTARKEVKDLADRIEKQYPIKPVDDYSNYPTACAAIFINQNEYFTEQFKKHLKTPRTMSDGDTVKNCFQLLADDIRIHPLSPMLTGAEKQFELMLKSWLEFSIDCVDWDEIARELVDNVPA